MEQNEEPKPRARKLGRRIYSLYVLKRKDRFQHADQLTVLRHAIEDQIQASKAKDEKEARENLVRLLRNEDLHVSSHNTFLDIPLPITSRDFYYIGEPLKTYKNRLMTRPGMHNEIGDVFDEMLRVHGGIENIPDDFNCFAFVEQRDASSTRLGLISLSDGAPIPRRVIFTGNFAIYRANLNVNGSITDYFKE